MEKKCYLVGQFEELGEVVQISFLPLHPNICGACAIGVWKGQGIRGDGKFMTPEDALAFDYYHYYFGEGDFRRLKKERDGLVYLCENASCPWFVDFVRALNDGILFPGDFLRAYAEGNHGLVPRSDAVNYCFI